MTITPADLPLQITAITAALLVPFYLGLTCRIIYLRITQRVSYGTKGNDIIARAIRAHGNFIEYVPFSLVLILLTELSGAPRTLMIVLGSMLIVGRAFHASAFLRHPMNYLHRRIGMAMTLFVPLISAATLLNLHLFKLF